MQTRLYSKEYQQANTSFPHSQALRVYVKRRAAVQQAQPFAVSVLEGGDSFIYSKGSLCYTFGQSQVRLLSFNQPYDCNWSFDVRELIKTRLSQVRKVHKHRCRPLHCAEGLLSCLYSSKTEQSATPLHWLLVIEVSKRSILTICELDRIDDIWVRNTKEWLYCGISTETEDEDVRSWVLFQHDARKRQWASNRVMLPDMPHGDIGVGNCFEIFDGYLYGASSRMPANFDLYESRGWNSFYYVFRFELGRSEKLEVLEKQAAWRRWPTDGNVDDRWGSLQLVKEEAEGEIYLYESRREFLETRPQSQRNCYRKQIQSSWFRPYRVRSLDSREPVRELSVGWDSESYRDDLDADDIHQGDDWYRDTTYKVREAPIRTYIPTCRTYLDVIARLQDPTADRPLLHIRARPKDLCRNQASTAIDQTPLGAKGAKRDQVADHGVNIWPSKLDLLHRDEQLTGLLEALYPDTTTQELLWYADEQFIVYAVEPVTEKMGRHIVVICFDPSVRLPGTESWHASAPLKTGGGCSARADAVGGLPVRSDPACSGASRGNSDTPRAFGLNFSY